MSEYEELSKYARLEDAELGDYCHDLLCLRYHNVDHGMSTNFSEAIDAEIRRMLIRFKAEATIVSRTEMVEHRYEELEWNNE